MEDAGRNPVTGVLPVPRSSVASPASRGTDDGGLVGVPADSRGRLVGREAPSSPIPLVPAKRLDPERQSHRDLPGAHLSVMWTWENMPAPSSGSEVNANGIKAARAATRQSWQVEVLEAGRIRVVVESSASALPALAELRARVDLYGHILLAPNIEHYRIIPPGALRTLLDEQRVDVTPMTEGLVGIGQNGRPYFGFPTRSVPVSTPWGTVDILQARMTNAGSGGVVLCRLLLELVGAQPTSPVCEEGKLPVRAAYQWTNGGKITFEVSSLLFRPDFPATAFLIPPARAAFLDIGLPDMAARTFLSEEQLGAFRIRSTDAPSPRTDPGANGAPAEGLLAVNSTDILRVLVLDGVPVASVPAHSEHRIMGPRAGKYKAQWRSFLGMTVDDPVEMLVPARLVAGD